MDKNRRLTKPNPWRDARRGEYARKICEKQYRRVTGASEIWSLEHMTIQELWEGYYSAIKQKALENTK